MNRHPLLAGFAIGAILAGGVVCIAGLVVVMIGGDSGMGELILLAIAGLAAIAGGLACVGWVQGWRDTVTDVGVGRPAPLTEERWPVSMAKVHERMATVSEQRDAAIAGQIFVQERLEAIVAGLRDGVLVVGPELSIISINDAACRMLSTTQRSAVGRPLVEIARDSDLVRVAGDAVAHGNEQTTPIDYRRAGRQLNLRVLPIEQGGQRLAVLVVQDVTEVRQLENVRKDFVANVSHELRTPLAAIRVLVETLDDGAIDDETVAHEFLKRVVDEVDRLNELIEDLLDLGRLESGRLPLRRTVIDVSVVISRSVERVMHQAEAANISIMVDIPDNLPALHVDASRVVQVLVNLLHNAIKYSPRGGSVEIFAIGAGDTIQISVRDYGSGILPEDLPRIFERFYKSDRARHSEGSGLGLAIAKHIMTAHGGRLTAESTYNAGATFTVSLPVAERSPSS